MGVMESQIIGGYGDKLLGGGGAYHHPPAWAVMAE